MQKDRLYSKLIISSLHLKFYYHRKAYKPTKYGVRNAIETILIF